MKLKSQLFLLFFCVLTVLDLHGQNTVTVTGHKIQGDTVIFWFAPEKDMFWADYKDNASSLQTMTDLISKYRSAIKSEEVKIRVLGFCSSYGSFKKNLSAAKNRSNQVKSYFIVHEGLSEDDFKTTNSTRRWKGMSDVIAVAYLFEPSYNSNTKSSETVQVSDNYTTDLSSESDSQMADTIVESVPTQDTLPLSSFEILVLTDTEASVESETSITKSNQTSFIPRFAVKTNVAYLAATVANLGFEYGFGKHYSIDFPVIYSPYVIKRDYRLQFLAIQPEFRYWLEQPFKGHFFGTHLNIGAFNIAVDNKTRYQSPHGYYGLGFSYGYMLPLSPHFRAEFTIGAGYIHTKYDTYYNIPNGARSATDILYNYFGLTKVGVSLVYTFGK